MYTSPLVALITYPVFVFLANFHPRYIYRIVLRRWISSLISNVRFFFSTTTCLHFHFNKIKAKYLIQQLLDMQKLYDTKSRNQRKNAMKWIVWQEMDLKHQSMSWIIFQSIKKVVWPIVTLKQVWFSLPIWQFIAYLAIIFGHFDTSLTKIKLTSKWNPSILRLLSHF